MKRFATLILILALASCARENRTTADATVHPKPPVAETRAFEVLSPHGTRNDPYYWLRDDTRKDPEVLAYLQAETDYAKAVLAGTESLQEQLYNELVGRIPQEDSTVPYRHGPFWYYERFEPGKEHPIHARRKGGPDGPEQILLDVNALAPAQGYYRVAAVEPSPDHRLLAFAEDTVGRRQYTLRVLDTASGEILPDRIPNAEPEIAWTSDNRSFLYIEKDPVTLLSKRVKRHVLGTEPSADTLIYEEADPSFYISIARSRTGRFIYIFMEGTLTTEYRYADAADPKLVLRTVLPREQGHEYRVRDLGDRFIIRTNWQAPNFRIVSVPIAQSANRKQWQDVVGAREDVFLHDFEVFRDFLAINERSGGLLKLRVKAWRGGEGDLVDSDESTYVMLLDKNKEPDSSTLRYTYSSLSTPLSTFELDMRSGKRTLLKREPVLGGFDPKNYRTEFLYAVARDGTRVPVSILHRAGFKQDGQSPCYQVGYGSYGYSYDPGFEPEALSLVDRGFVYAIAHIRGGQEMGRAWYDNGRLLNKKNTFTDFIDVTRFLVEQKFCARDAVFAMGRSAGGLLMGAVANIAPADYRGIIAYVPFVDVVTTMLDESIPLTTNEFDEWGNPKQKPFYDYMLSYSPYDNVTAQAYPAMFVMTGLWDSQVQYFEPAKWVAKLRAHNTGSAPILFHVDMQAGHSGKPGRFERFRDTAREYAFILQQMGATNEGS
jgi:oligopeptidase B